MKTLRPIVWAILAFAATATGCGGTPMSPQGPLVPEPVVADVLEALSRPVDEVKDDVIVGLTTAPTHVVVFDLATGKERWRQPVDARIAPLLVSDGVVLQTSAGQIVGYDLKKGSKWLEQQVSGDLVGATGSRERLIVALARKAGSSPRSLVLGIEKGKLSWTRELQYEVGVPVVSGTLVVVPWAGQRVSVLDASTGDERLRFETPTLVTQAFADNGRLYLGANDLYRIGPGLDTDPRGKGLVLSPLRRSLPGSPNLVRSGIGPAPTPADAFFRVRLAWRATSTDAPVGLERDLLYFVYYRFVFAFSASEDRLVWAYAHPQNLAGVAAFADALMIVGQDGSVAMLAAEDGRDMPGASLGTKLEMAVVRGGNVKVATGEAGALVPLEQRLLHMARDPDSALTEGQALAVRALGAFDSDGVTESLVGLCLDAALPEAVQKAACDQLGSGRSKGAKFVREALTRRAAFLAGTQAPPSGALGAFAASSRLPGVLPDLLAHLASPATPSAELPGVLQAIAVLGNAAAATQVASFLTLYHAEPANSPLIPALAQAAETLVVLEKRKASFVLDPILTDPFTSEPLQKRIRATVATLEKTDTASAEEEKPTAAASVPEDTRPQRLSDKHVASALKPVLPKLRKCLSKTLQSVKLVLMIDGKGELVTQAATPPDASACIDPILKSVQFPQSKVEDTQRVVFFLKR